MKYRNKVLPAMILKQENSSKVEILCPVCKNNILSLNSGYRTWTMNELEENKNSTQRCIQCNSFYTI